MHIHNRKLIESDRSVGAWNAIVVFLIIAWFGSKLAMGGIERLAELHDEAFGISAAADAIQKAAPEIRAQNELIAELCGKRN